jgi:hypothetical protein
VNANRRAAGPEHGRPRKTIKGDFSVNDDSYRENAKARLFETLAEVAERLSVDPRWEEERDDFGVEVVGMLLFGYGFMVGRTIHLMDREEICDGVVQVLAEKLGVAKKWAGGLVEEASLSIFDRKNHAIHHDLIAQGHRYFGRSQQEIVENIFMNIDTIKGRLPSDA